METILADLRYGARLLRRSPAFTTVTILTLALGIGANTAIFSVVDTVLLRPLPFGEPDRVAMVWEDATFAGFPRNTPSPANFTDWKARNRVFLDMAATQGNSASLTEDGSPEQVMGRATTANFFSVLQAVPALGRTFTEQEDRDGARVVVISYGLWQRRYGGRPSIVGQNMTMNGAARTVVGVMPRDFVFRSREIDYWIPISFTPQRLAQRGSHFLQVVGRLKPGVTMRQARDEMNAIATQMQREFPATNQRVGVQVVPIVEDVLGDTRLELAVLMAASLCVLLIACANLASLLLSRAVGRRGEFGIRTALGAPSGRLVRQMIAESMLLSLAGGATGLVLAPAGIAVVARLIPLGIPAGATSVIDGRLLIFTLLLSIATGLAFSIVPSLQAARASVADALQHATRGGVGSRNRTVRDGLVVLQVAAALVLLVAAGLMIRTLVNLRALELGFRADHLLTLETTLPPRSYPDAVARTAFYDRVLERVGRLPGVTAAAFGSMLPFQSTGNTISYEAEGRALPAGDPGDVLLRAGTNAYLATLGVRLVEGRLPDGRDGPAAPAVIVINDTLARRLWPAESALGHRIRIMSSTNPWRTIVGVVHDVRERGYLPAAKPGVYLPYAQAPDTWAIPDSLIVRAAGDPLALVAAVRQAIAEVDPAQPITAIRTMDEIIALNVSDRQQQMTLLGAFAALALLLAAVGLYGVLWYAVTQRSREIGLRMALGATRTSVMRMFVGRGAALIAAGVTIGAAGAWAVTRTMTTLLYGVSPADPFTFGVVVAALGAVGIVASAIPALRATRLDPLAVLRDD